MSDRRRGTRALELGAAGLAALCLVACGGSAEKAAPPPTLPPLLAASLAAQSDAVAVALGAGNSCRALTLARRLRRDTIAAINAGRVDAQLQEELQGAVNDIASRVTCTPAVVTRPEDEEPDRGKHHGKDKHEGKD